MKDFKQTLGLKIDAQALLVHDLAERRVVRQTQMCLHRTRWLTWFLCVIHVQNSCPGESSTAYGRASAGVRHAVATATPPEPALTRLPDEELVTDQRELRSTSMKLDKTGSDAPYPSCYEHMWSVLAKWVTMSTFSKISYFYSIKRPSKWFMICWNWTKKWHQNEKNRVKVFWRNHRAMLDLFLQFFSQQ